MRQRLQVRSLRKMAARGLIGAGLLVMAFCAVTVRASAARHGTTHAKAHVAARKTASPRPANGSANGPASAPRKGTSTKSSKPSLRNVSYKAPTHKRRRRRTKRHHITLPKQPAADRTEEIQSALGRGGFYSGNPNGKWDGGTQEALRRFQIANGLPPTGKLDALSLQKLGLGSDVAGLSAPRPVTSGNQSSSQSPNQPPASPDPKTPGR